MEVDGRVPSGDPACWAVFPRAQGVEVLLKDGRVLRGKLGELSGLAEKPETFKNGGRCAVRSSTLWTTTCGTYFSKRLIREVHPEENRPIDEKFTIWQRAKHGGGLMVTERRRSRWPIEPFDEFGRRNFTMITDKGTLSVTQGITELTPQWAKVEGTIAHLGHADRHQLDPPRHPAKNPVEADRSDEDRALQERSRGSISSRSATPTRGRRWKPCWPRFPMETI